MPFILLQQHSGRANVTIRVYKVLVHQIQIFIFHIIMEIESMYLMYRNNAPFHMFAPIKERVF